jgi:uncharacterized protein YjbI with pentapeptide repeats
MEKVIINIEYATSSKVLHTSADYPEFSGTLFSEFVLFLIGKKVSLANSDLREANLSESNLYKANLSESNLYKANLSESNLSEANLSESNLYKANLSESNLYKANLSEANLSEANLSIYCKWVVSYFQKLEIVKDYNDFGVNIGCKTKVIAEWDNFFNSSSETFSTPRDSEDFNIIKANYEAVRAYLVCRYPLK